MASISNANADAATAESRAGGSTTRKTTFRKLAVLAVAAGAFVATSVMFGDYLTLDYLGQQEAALRNYQASHFWIVFAVAFVVYVAVTGLSLPGAAGLTMTCGWLFGFWRGVLVVSFASTTGATLAFLLSRYLLRDVVQRRFGDRLASFNRALEKEGAFYLFSLRLIPAVPFFVINVVMGLTPLRVWTYWWVSQLGMLAGTAVYVYAGAQFPTLGELAQQGVGGVMTLQILIAFVMLGLFPIVVKKTMSRLRPDTKELAG